MSAPDSITIVRFEDDPQRSPSAIVNVDGKEFQAYFNLEIRETYLTDTKMTVALTLRGEDRLLIEQAIVDYMCAKSITLSSSPPATSESPSHPDTE